MSDRRSIGTMNVPDNVGAHIVSPWRERNLRVDCLVSGGAVDKQDEELLTVYGALVRLGRISEANEYQGGALFMLSDAVSHVNGANDCVIVGWTAR